MPLSDEEISVRFGAETADLRRGLDDVVSSVNHSVEDMKTRLESLSEDVHSSIKEGFGEAFEGAASAVEKFSHVVVGIGVAFGGGKVFHEMIEATLKVTEDVHNLSLMLGVTTEEASILRIALDNIGVSTSTYESAAFRLSMQLRNNAEKLKEFGIELVDAEGNHKSLQAIISQGIGVLKEYKEGFDRNAVSIAMFGRGAKEMTDLQRLNDDVLKHASETALDYGLVVGEEDVEAMHKFKSSMADVHEFILAFMRTIGDSLMPILTDMSDWFRTIAPTAIEMFKIAITGAAIALQELKLGFMTVWATGEMALRELVIGWQTLGNIMLDISKGHFSQAVADSQDGWEKIKSVASSTLDDIVVKAEKTNSELARLLQFGSPAPKENKKEETGLKEYGFEDKQKQKDGEIEIERKASEEQKRIMEDVVEHKRDLDRIDNESERQKIEFRHSMGLISKAEELSELQKLEDDKYNIDLKALQDSQEFLDEGTLAFKKNVDAIEDLEAKHQLKMQEMEQQRVLAVKADYDHLFSGITNAFNSSVTGMVMGTQTMRQAMSRIGTAIVGEFVSMGVKRLTSWVATELAMTTATTAGTTARTAAESKGFLASIANVVRKIAAWISGETATTAATITESTTKTTSESAAAMTSLGVKTAANTATIIGDSAAAAAGAYAATALIPFVGPELAPVAAETARIAVLGNLAFAKGGFDVPHDQLVYAHKDEMVLPSHLAENIRNMSSLNNVFGDTYSMPSSLVSFYRNAQNNQATVNNNITSEDGKYQNASGNNTANVTYSPVFNTKLTSREVKTLLRDHQDVIGDIVLKQMRKLRAGMNKL